LDWKKILDEMGIDRPVISDQQGTILPERILLPPAYCTDYEFEAN
jgi:hypothetical protein